MFITDQVTITELSRLTKRSRPTIYKYINDYLSGNYDDIPFSFLKLFQMSSNCSKSDIEHYCHKTYGNNSAHVIDTETQARSKLTSGYRTSQEENLSFSECPLAKPGLPRSQALSTTPNSSSFFLKKKIDLKNFRAVLGFQQC